MENNLVPQGEYTARACGEVQIGRSKTGNEFLRCTFQVDTADGPRLLVKDFHFTEKTMERSVESIRHCGWTGDDLSTLAVGREGFGLADVSVTVEHDEYTLTEGERAGQTRTVAKIGWVNSLSGGARVKPLPENERKAFGARMRGLAMKSKSMAAAPTQRTQRQQAQPPKNAGDAWEPGGPPDMPPFSDEMPG